jgi:hypothetical protein
MIVVGRMAVGIGCVVVGVATGCSSPSPGSAPRAPASVSAVALRPAMSAIQEQSIPGVGATRANWDAMHALNALSDTGSDYGDDPSLPPYVTNNGAVYKEVKDLGTERIQAYYLAMHTVDAQEVLRQLRQELPPDASIAWDLTRDQCYRVAFNSPTLQVAGGYMVEAELQYIQQDGTPATSPDRFNIASFWLDEAGSPPDPDKDC